MERLIAASPMSAMGPDRVKTRSEFLYRRAEHNFSRFFAVRAATGLEIQAAVEGAWSFRTVSGAIRGKDRQKSMPPVSFAIVTERTWRVISIMPSPPRNIVQHKGRYVARQRPAQKADSSNLVKLFDMLLSPA